MKKISAVLSLAALSIISVAFAASLTKEHSSALREISKELNNIRKEIFTILDNISGIDKSVLSADTLAIIDDIEDALAETRHYLDHEAELIYTMPYVKDEYADYLIDNRIEGIKRAVSIVKLYQLNLGSYYRKLGEDSAVRSAGDPTDLMSSSLDQLNKALDILGSAMKKAD